MILQAERDYIARIADRIMRNGTDGLELSDYTVHLVKDILANGASQDAVVIKDAFPERF